jgi:hypothetical protein
MACNVGTAPRTCTYANVHLSKKKRPFESTSKSTWEGRGDRAPKKSRKHPSKQFVRAPNLGMPKTSVRMRKRMAGHVTAQERCDDDGEYACTSHVGPSVGGECLGRVPPPQHWHLQRCAIRQSQKVLVQMSKHSHTGKVISAFQMKILLFADLSPRRYHSFQRSHIWRG